MGIDVQILFPGSIQNSISPKSQNEEIRHFFGPKGSTGPNVNFLVPKGKWGWGGEGKATGVPPLHIYVGASVASIRRM